MIRQLDTYDKSLFYSSLMGKILPNVIEEMEGIMKTASIFTDLVDESDDALFATTLIEMQSFYNAVLRSLMGYYRRSEDSAIELMILHAAYLAQMDCLGSATANNYPLEELETAINEHILNLNGQNGGALKSVRKSLDQITRQAGGFDKLNRDAKQLLYHWALELYFSYEQLIDKLSFLYGREISPEREKIETIIDKFETIMPLTVKDKKFLERFVSTNIHSLTKVKSLELMELFYSDLENGIICCMVTPDKMPFYVSLPELAASEGTEQEYIDILIDSARNLKDKAPAGKKAAAKSSAKTKDIKPADEIYQIKIELMDIKPSIWRKIEIPSNSTFSRLHRAIQDAMGWGDCHLYSFNAFDLKTNSIIQIEMPDDDNPDALRADKIKIRDYLIPESPLLEYIYDLGDDWFHRIKLEKVLPKKAGVTYPICTGGKRACPPEDSGGVDGYKEMLKTIKGRNSDEKAELMQWLGENFDPERFDPKTIKFRK